MTDTGWVRTYEHDGDYIESIGGTTWSDAPLPHPWHHCKAQTRGWFGLNYTERCACGATRLSAWGQWIGKNETRHAREKERRDARAPKEMVTCGECGASYEAIAGSRQASERLCATCWGGQLVRDYHPDYRAGWKH